MTVLRGISSMATRQLLASLATAYAESGTDRLDIESVGGVDAARRVQDGETFDLVFLATAALDALAASGRIAPGSRTVLAESPVAVAVGANQPRPAIDSEDALRHAVLAAPRIGYSTGPSGTALLQLFARWGLADTLAPRLVQAPAGVPVASLLACGEVALGFQQLAELMDQPGIALLGPLPEAAAITTVFEAACCAASAHPTQARALLGFIAAPVHDALKRRHGMQPG